MLYEMMFKLNIVYFNVQIKTSNGDRYKLAILNYLIFILLSWSSLYILHVLHVINGSSFLLFATNWRQIMFKISIALKKEREMSKNVCFQNLEIMFFSERYILFVYRRNSWKKCRWKYMCAHQAKNSHCFIFSNSK